jgi:hypothetical protein
MHETCEKWSAQRLPQNAERPTLARYHRRRGGASILALCLKKMVAYRAAIAIIHG